MSNNPSRLVHLRVTLVADASDSFYSYLDRLPHLFDAYALALTDRNTFGWTLPHVSPVQLIDITLSDHSFTQSLSPGNVMRLILERMEQLSKQQQMLTRQAPHQRSGESIDANEGMLLNVTNRRLYLFYLVDSLVQRSIKVSIHACAWG